ncbi:hypothetical protein Sru01_13930 [Sphaerisporangium rufum]|uniref:Uncharacterized protein n=1 Tax=Sphaerisporangium rufum TaxID=1381558 RepID=A0A919R0Z6_9ACTN|nr:hypothetical protein Sru01_13930 [Sphaerisporangium rufum]
MTMSRQLQAAIADRTYGTLRLSLSLSAITPPDWHVRTPDARRRHTYPARAVSHLVRPVPRGSGRADARRDGVAAPAGRRD